MEAAALQPCEWGPCSTPTLGGCSEAASPVLNGQTPPALDPPHHLAYNRLPPLERVLVPSCGIPAPHGRALLYSGSPSVNPDKFQKSCSEGSVLDHACP